MGVHVVRVGDIPFGMSVLIDEQPGSLVVWLLESEWPEAVARLIERVLNVLHTVREPAAPVAQPPLRAV